MNLNLLDTSESASSLFERRLTLSLFHGIALSSIPVNGRLAAENVTGKLHQAVFYFLNQKEHLMKFMEHGDIDISNNAVERLIRNLVPGAPEIQAQFPADDPFECNSHTTDSRAVW